MDGVNYDSSPLEVEDASGFCIPYTPFKCFIIHFSQEFNQKKVKICDKS